jgi:hypothetical protein
LVKDVVRSADYFQDRVGFTIDQLQGDPPRFAILRRDGYAVMLSKVKPDVEIVPNWRIVRNMWDIYFWVDDIEALYAELQSRQAIIDYTLCIQPHGTKEFGIQDLDGHDIAFGQILR